jgi:hypothetical protein
MAGLCELDLRPSHHALLPFAGGCHSCRLTASRLSCRSLAQLHYVTCPRRGGRSGGRRGRGAAGGVGEGARAGGPVARAAAGWLLLAEPADRDDPPHLPHAAVCLHQLRARREPYATCTAPLRSLAGIRTVAEPPRRGLWRSAAAALPAYPCAKGGTKGCSCPPLCPLCSCARAASRR